MDKTQNRRLHFDDDDAEKYEEFGKKQTPFKKLPYIDLFSIALVYGREKGDRTELKKKGSTIGRVVESVIDNSDLRYLMKAIAVDEKDSLNAVLDVNEYFLISEEYAKTGLEYFYEDFINNKNLLDDMEEELHDFYLEHEEELHDFN